MKKYALSTVVAVGLLFAPNAADAFSVDADSMSEGDVNDSVNELQTELKDLGYFQGSTGSTFGPRTLSAVQAYQEDHGISSPAGNFFGVAGPQTIGSLEGSSSSDESTSSEGSSSSMSNGDTGESVSDLQAQLQDLGYYEGNVDSIFGPQTESAVKAFQQDHGVSSPAGNFFGVAGPATLSALEGQPSENTGNSDNSGDNASEGSSESDNSESNNSSNESSDNSGSEDNSSESSNSESESSNESDSGSDNSGSENSGNEEGNNDELVDSASTDNNSGSSDSSSNGDVDSLIDTAMAQKGTPYVWGGTTPSGFDCSGFINYVFEQNGQGFGHRADTSSLYNMSTPVDNPSAGDLVFFDTSGGVSHAGIYIGNGEFVHASASNGVKVDSLDDPYYWGDRYIGAGSL